MKILHHLQPKNQVFYMVVSFENKNFTVLYICVGFWLLAHLTLDLSQAEKMTTIFTENDNFNNFWAK